MPANENDKVVLSKEEYEKLVSLEQILKDVSYERDLFREEWLKLRRELGCEYMTEQECEEMIRTGVDSETLLAEVEAILNKSE
jgi:hypothetical protein